LLKSLANQGRSDDGAWLVHSRLGFNYRLSDVHAAIGVAQLERLDDMLAGRARAAQWYQDRVASIPGVTPMYEGDQERSWFVYAPRLAEGIDRDAVIGQLDQLGVSAKPYLPCIHLQPFYREEFGYAPGALPVTEAISASTIALPFFPEMTEAQVGQVTTALSRVLAEMSVAAGA
jgi:perosamine synthetase